MGQISCHLVTDQKVANFYNPESYMAKPLVDFDASELNFPIRGWNLV